MEDFVYGISHQKTPFFTKKLISQYLLNDINEYIKTHQSKSVDNGVLAHRRKLDIDDNLRSDILEELLPILRSYDSDIECHDMRIYIQDFGNIKRHIDASLDGKSQFTCLIYLNQFEGGELKLKFRRQPDEKDPNKYTTYTFRHEAGQGIIFKKSILHEANEVESQKIIMLVDIESEDFMNQLE